jgi:3-phosphoshikimate 1-carboxyvinyltransferase
MTANRYPDRLLMRPLDRPPDAVVTVPGSKSVTNRALVCAALAAGTTVLHNVLVADDTEAMVGVLDAVGVDVRMDRDGRWVEVVGCDGAMPASDAEIDVRQSGTTARFVPPMLALGAGSYRVTGHPQLLARPMGPTFDALRALGVPVEELAGRGLLPATVRAGGARGGVIRLPGDVSSQFLSGLLMAAPYLPGGLVIELTTRLVSRPYVELTRSVMRSFGVEVEAPDPETYIVAPGNYRATDFTVEPDASAASYFFAAAAITGGRVRVAGLTAEASQGDVAFVDVLERMGATVDRRPEGIEVTGPTSLSGGSFDFTDISDTAQTLAAVAVFADAPVRVTGIGFIRRKETDRIAAVVTELRRAGIRALEEADGFVIRPGVPRPTTVKTYDDHRMAMSFALLGLRVPGVEIDDPGCVSKTFPEFYDVLESLRGVTPSPDR